MVNIEMAYSKREKDIFSSDDATNLDCCWGRLSNLDVYASSNHHSFKAMMRVAIKQLR